MNTANAAILIVAYKSRESLPQVIEALGCQSLRPARVRVLENGSPDGERVQESDFPDWVDFVESEDNLGFAAGNNLLARGIEEDWLICLNPDAFPDADWLEQLMSAVQTYPDIDLFGSTQRAHGQEGVLDGVGDVYHFTGQAYRAGYGKTIMVPEDGEVFAPCAAASMIRRRVFEALGGFDEDFFCYSEDVDLGYRARLAGHRCMQLKSAQVSHVGYGSSARRSDFATYYGVRNRFWTLIKNTPWALLSVMMPFHIGFAILHGLSSARFGLFKTYLRAIRDGVAAWPELMAKRRTTTSVRRISVVKLASMMSWKPFALLTREPDIRRYR